MNYLKSIYQYKNYRKYLVDFYHYKKKQSPNFTYQQFSKLAKIKSPNFFKLIMDGKRNLTIEKIHQFATGLNLSHLERNYFEILVLYNQAESKETKKYYKNKLDEQNQFVPQRKGKFSANDIIACWYYPVIILYLNEKNIHQELGPLAKIINLSCKEIEQIILKLLKNGLFKIKDKKYYLNSDYIHVNDNKYNITQQNYLKAQIDRSLRAFQAKYKQEIEYARFFSHTFTFSKEKWDKYIELTKSFLETTTNCSNQDLPESIGQMNIQLFLVE